MRSLPGGIGGLATALVPNALHAFDYLDIGDEARRMAVYVDQIRLMDAMPGEDIARVPLDEPFRNRLNNP